MATIYLAAAFVVLVKAILVAHASADSDRQIGTFIVGEYTRGGCELQGLYPHDIMSHDVSQIRRRYTLGQQWRDNCNNCSCTTAGVVCRGPTDCPHPYDFTQEEWCIEWSEDGCCCERMGCTVDGEKYELGEHFPYGKYNSCLTCPCQVGTSRAQCLLQECDRMELTCESMSAVYAYRQCCPIFICPHGVECDTIPDPFPNTPNHELLDWYGHLDPIPQGMNQHFHLDSWTSYVCSCETGGTADCEMRTFGMP